MDHRNEIGVVGLGRMGGSIARRLLRRGHGCVVWDRNEAAIEAVAKDGAQAAGSLDDLVSRLGKPRTVWVMLPAGAATDGAITALGERLEAGDVVIDGGNTNYRDDIRRAAALKSRGIAYLDVGTSGGIWGLERGYCLMVGGDRAVAARHAWLFEALAADDGRGQAYVGPVGAGHFVKMVHNAIEYGLMQAYAEGFALLQSRSAATLPEPERFEADLSAVAEVWRHGSVISSWLLDLSAAALAKDPQLAGFTGRVEDSGEGRWALQAAIESAVPAPALAAALFARFESRQAEGGFAGKLLSAMRLGFGGHRETG